ncbi:MAG: glycosyltransferase family 4 protein [Candidatus Jacksonbacteria bacterium]|nr:glycosyltransferase family 4 protein [Candidatus Jacksonbacteria bacterium]MBT6300876.1 glycosyltransferase family 4 protein [Candidatus Jacksonbacteria bacterium]MBT6757128.1 glycosyltransferase family 4 protein [Candidatus Jacksonbacteria bacterium]MBT7008784.1 glycosyltransferase family 4 protein [Candidatus Jacksonbacteria bacterium]MBT7339418.1 glycosyltransferase family 4 protein [Candidatus Jacksonbacteria bacterium]
MKIAMIGQKGIPCRFGGIERHVEELTKGLVAEGHEIFVYARKEYTPLQVKEFEGVHIVHMPSLRTKHLDTITYTFAATMHALFQGYNVIHYHGVGPSLLSFIPRILKPKVKVVATIHCLDRLVSKWGFFAKFMLGVGEWAACTFPHKTITVSRSLQDYIQSRFGKNTVCISNGIPAQIENEDPSRTLRDTFGLEAGEYILNVSRFIPSKNVDMLIRAWKKTKNIHNKKLVLVGDSSMGSHEYKSKLMKLADHDDDILFLGWQQMKELQVLYAGACVYVHPSSAEGLSTTILEAFSQGALVLMADIAGNREISSDRRFFFEDGDLESLVEGLVRVIETKEETKDAVSKMREHVIATYGWPTLIFKLIEFYSHCISETKQREFSKKYSYTYDK